MKIKLLTSAILLALGSNISNADEVNIQKPIPASSQTTNQEQQKTTVENQQPTTSTDKSAIKQPEPIDPAKINCEYKIDPTMAVNNETVIIWSEKAAVQTFSYTSENIDDKIKDLKNCFTDQGFTGYTDALSKSGNVEAIKNQKLSVSSLVDGKTIINKMEDNKWQLKVPLQVVYQNDKEKLTQLLFIDMLVARKVSGELGILQIIAAPRDKMIDKK